MPYPKRRRPNNTANGKRVSVLCTEEEYKTIKAAADKLKMGVSPFLADAGVEKAERSRAAE